MRLLNLLIRAVVLLLVGLFVSTATFSQVTFNNEGELIEQANKLFGDENYVEAKPLFSQLLSLHPEVADYNYKFGVCKLFTDADKNESLVYLEAAAGIAGVANEAFFYLGKGYHLNFRFDDAITQFNKYKAGLKGAADTKDADRQIAMCKNGKQLFDPDLIFFPVEKNKTIEREFFRKYDLRAIQGKVLPRTDNFKTKYDKKINDNTLMFVSQLSSELYFSGYGEEGATGSDIYRANKLPNGEWAIPQRLPDVINTQYDEAYAFMHPEGDTLYFSSKGHNTMGGYDIFRSVIDREKNTWSAPVNMKYPYSTPDDDILYAIEFDREFAYFATKNFTEPGKMTVYKVSTSDKKDALGIVSGHFSMGADTLLTKAQITVADKESGTLVGIFNSNKLNGKYLLALPKGKTYALTIEPEGFVSHKMELKVPSKYDLPALGQKIAFSKGAEGEKIVLTNNFDDTGKPGETVQTSVYSPEQLTAQASQQGKTVMSMAQYETFKKEKKEAAKDYLNTLAAAKPKQTEQVASAETKPATEPEKPSNADDEKAKQDELAKAEVAKKEAEAKEQARLAEEKAKKEAAEKAKQEELAKAEAAKKEAEAKEQARLAEEKVKKEAAEKAKQEELAKAAEAAKKEAEAKEQARLAEEKAKKEAAEKAKQEELAKAEAAKKEAEAKEQARLADEKAKKEAAEKAKQEELVKVEGAKQEAEAKEQARLADEKAKKEAAEKAKQEELAKAEAAKKEAEAKEQARLAEEKAKKEAAEKAKQEELAKTEAAKKEAEAKEQASLEEEKAKKEAAEKAKQEELAKAEVAKKEAEAKEQARLAEEKTKKEAAEKAKQEELAKAEAAKKEAEAKEQARLAEEKTKKEAAEKAKQEELAKAEAAKKEAETKLPGKEGDYLAEKSKTDQQQIEAHKAEAEKKKTELAQKEQAEKERLVVLEEKQKELEKVKSAEEQALAEHKKKEAEANAKMQEAEKQNREAVSELKEDKTLRGKVDSLNATLTKGKEQKVDLPTTAAVAKTEEEKKLEAQQEAEHLKALEEKKKQEAEIVAKQEAEHLAAVKKQEEEAAKQKKEEELKAKELAAKQAELKKEMEAAEAEAEKAKQEEIAKTEVTAKEEVAKAKEVELALAEEAAKKEAEAKEQALLAAEKAKKAAEAKEQARLAEEKAKKEKEAAEKAKQEELARVEAEKAEQAKANTPKGQKAEEKSSTKHDPYSIVLEEPINLVELEAELMKIDDALAAILEEERKEEEAALLRRINAETRGRMILEQEMKAGEAENTDSRMADVWDNRVISSPKAEVVSKPFDKTDLRQHEGVHFKIEVVLKSAVISDVVQERMTAAGELVAPSADEYVTYTTGYYKTLADITLVKSEMKDRGIKDFRVIAYHNGEEIPLSQVKSIPFAN